MGVSPTLWNHMITNLGVKTLLDVGCGRGISTSYFILHGLEYVVCAEGSHDAVSKSVIPTLSNVPPQTKHEIVEHVFSRGPWWPSRTVDVALCVEFAEHVGRNYQQNYYTAFRKAAIIFQTHSNWGGWHHVEVHDDDWWRLRMESMGFVYSEILTKQMRSKASEENKRTDLRRDWKSDKSYNVGQHLWANMQVFNNPLVASLPEHAHLFAEHGCFSRAHGGKCGQEGIERVSDLTPLPESFKPLKITPEMDVQWMDMVKDL